MLDLSTKIKSLPLKAVLFDLDDTLYESASIYASGVQRAWECFCAETDKNWDFPTFKSAYETARAYVKQLAPTSPTRHSRLTYFAFLVSSTFGRPGADLALKLDRAYTTTYHNIDFGPARELLKKLQPHLKIAIVTNQTMDAQLHKLRALDPTSSLIDCMVTSEEVGIEKPDASIFKECLRRLKVNPQEVLMVGDDWENDIIGACAVGIASVFLDRKSPQRLIQADPIIISTDSIANISRLLKDHL